MTKYFVFVFMFALLGTEVSAQIKIGKLIQAGGDIVSAVALSDSDIAEMSRKAIEVLDAQSTVETGEYADRIKKLTENLTIDGLKLNFKVYRNKQWNAFACGDGSVRINSALMDTLSDNELIAIIGQRLGHVARNDAKEVIKNAYLRSAANNAVGSVSGNAANRLSEAQLSTLATTLSEAQYTQKQVYDADDYAFAFCLSNHIDPYAMYNALTKLAELGRVNMGNASPLLKSLKDGDKRIARMKEKADELQK